MLTTKKIERILYFPLYKCQALTKDKRIYLKTSESRGCTEEKKKQETLWEFYDVIARKLEKI